ncbi:Flp pilus assembly protein CpaB, partial [Geodermatophilus nigrescens]
QVAAPVRLADLGVARLAAAGDRVDVLATSAGTPSAATVARGALVLAAPDDEGLLVLAVDEDTAATLAAAATTATLTLTLPAPP